MMITNTHSYIKFLIEKDPHLKKLFNIVPSISIPFDNDGFHFLMFTILGQQVSAYVASMIFQRFKNSIVPLNAHSLLDKDDDMLRAIGIPFSKIHTMKRVALYCVNNNFHFNTFLDKTKTDLFINLKGIGPWTMDMYEMFVLKNFNHFSFKDLGLIQGLKYIYEQPLNNIEEMKKVSLLWSPYQSIVAHFLWEYWDNFHKGKRNE